MKNLQIRHGIVKLNFDVAYPNLIHAFPRLGNSTLSRGLTTPLLWLGRTEERADMYPNSPTPQKLVQNHFLVFVHNLRLSPLLLNDNHNSFEVFSINSTAEFVNCFQSQRPGCLITDTNNDFFDCPNLNMMSRLLPVIMVTNSNSVRKAADAARKGAHTVLRDFSNEERIRDAVRAACFADAFGDHSPSVLRTRINDLTTKERQVVYMSLRGKTTKMISNELNVCHQTVDKHKKRALSKLSASSVIDLMNILMDCQRKASGVRVFETERLQAPKSRPGVVASEQASKLA